MPSPGWRSSYAFLAAALFGLFWTDASGTPLLYVFEGQAQADGNWRPDPQGMREVRFEFLLDFTQAGEYTTNSGEVRTLADKSPRLEDGTWGTGYDRFFCQLVGGTPLPGASLSKGAGYPAHDPEAEADMRYGLVRTFYGEDGSVSDSESELHAGSADAHLLLWGTPVHEWSPGTFVGAGVTLAGAPDDYPAWSYPLTFGLTLTSVSPVQAESVAAVPEPGTLGLMCSGLLFLSALALRSRRAASRRR